MAEIPESTILMVNIVLGTMAVLIIAAAIATEVNTISEGGAHFKLRSDLRTTKERAKKLEEGSEAN